MGRLRAALLLSLVPLACSSSVLLDQFNSGLLDSAQDPAIDAAQLGYETAFRIVRESTMGAYYDQGGGSYVARWYEAGCTELDHLVACVECRAKQRAAGRETGVGQLSEVDELLQTQATPTASAAGPIDPLRDTCGDVVPDGRHGAAGPCFELGRDLLAVTEQHHPPSVPAQVCIAAGETGGTATRAAEHALDVATFLGGIDEAVEGLTRVVDEGVVTRGSLKAGACQALHENGAYIANRKWKRERNRAVSSLVVKGGASTGIYSAGAVWRILTVADRCLADDGPGGCKERSGGKVQLELLSGTSAGALVVAVTDLFHQQSCLVEKQPYVGTMKKAPEFEATSDPARCRKEALEMLSTFFRCVSRSDLYCSVEGQVPDLFSTQLGLVRFDGIRDLMTRYVREGSLSNPSELIPNSVDFRWGELYAPSDQDPATTHNPADVVDAIEASFVLPFIAEPVGSLRLHGEPQPGRYLDGGIRSELPLLSAVQRGATHMLVISSSPSRIVPASPQRNALEIATRYIDVSLSAVTEGELARAEVSAKLGEQRRRTICEKLLTEKKACTPPLCEAEAVCSGTWDAMCDGEDDPRARSSFHMRTIFRNAMDVDGSFGYSFDPSQLRRLFDAGAEAMRQRCVEVAGLIGIKADTPAQKEQLRLWCSEVPQERASYCSGKDLEVKACE
jgi:predicted acylesterase/phospholipase RssA